MSRPILFCDTVIIIPHLLSYVQWMVMYRSRQDQCDDLKCIPKKNTRVWQNDQSTADLSMLTLTLCGAGVYLGIETCMLRIAGPIHPHRHIRQYEAGRPEAKSREDRQVAVKNPAWFLDLPFLTIANTMERHCPPALPFFLSSWSYRSGKFP